MAKKDLSQASQDEIHVMRLENMVRNYRELFSFMVVNKCFRGFSTMDFMLEKQRKIDPEIFVEADTLMGLVKQKKEEVK